MESSTECNNNELSILTNSIMSKVQIVQNNERNANKTSTRLMQTSIFRQITMVILANLGVISTGMALGFPAVSLNQLTDSTGDFHMTSAQASWFGKYFFN